MQQFSCAHSATRRQALRPMDYSSLFAIIDYPDRLRTLLHGRGDKLPKPVREQRRGDCVAEPAAV